MAKKERSKPTVNSSSMADIAFLLLIFFLVTTTIASDKGILFTLPPKPDKDEIIDVKIPQRNIFKILINSQDKMLVEDEPFSDMSKLKGMVKEFVLNNGRDPKSSDSPKDAIVSVKADRGTSYEKFIEVLDILEGTYMEMYGDRVGLTGEQFRGLDLKNPKDRERYEIARKDFPKNISIAEPNKI